MKKLAIVSVYDKQGVVPFAKTLLDLGYEILSTGGTGRLFNSEGVQYVPISEYTGQEEILDGRVKTLHPKIHGGILARRDNPQDLEQLASQAAAPIEIVVVNLYPFIDKINEIQKSGTQQPGSLVELIDIGGPTMIRAAAKNFKDVIVICDPADYVWVAEELKAHGEVSLEKRRLLAAKVFRSIALYDAAIARHFFLEEQVFDEDGNEQLLAPFEALVLKKDTDLRYGENPHQRASLYQKDEFGSVKTPRYWTQLQGKELSYNNLLDMEAAVSLFAELDRVRGQEHLAVVIKHSNPCGVAQRATALEAFVEARSCDPLSAFGGVIAVSGTLEQELAETMLEGFVEVVIAPQVSDGAREVFKTKKNVRVIEFDYAQMYAAKEETILVKNVFNEYLLQTADGPVPALSEEQVVTETKPNTQQLADMEFAWRITKHVKSNAIVIVKNKKAIGVGAGQMSRVDAAKFAISRATLHQHSLEGAFAGSDAFLPFADTLEVLHDAGVVGLVQPGGSIKDKDVISVANERKVMMLCAGQRHFRH